MSARQYFIKQQLVGVSTETQGAPSALQDNNELLVDMKNGEEITQSKLYGL